MLKHQHLPHAMRWLRTGLSITVSSMAIVASVQAAAPQVKTQAPGFYRMMLGDFEITALSDGTIDLPLTQLLTNTTAEETLKALAKSFLKPAVETSVNAYLINTGPKLVLVDAGDPPLLRPMLGKLQMNLKAAGYQPEQVDAVLITHMHRDHVGGLMNGDKLAFPNATVYANRKDADYWLSQTNMDKAPEAVKSFFKVAMASINPYASAGKFKTFDGDTELVPGISARVAPGHTPGHTAYVVESKDQKLMLWGDMLHIEAIQFNEPGVTLLFDVDAQAAAEQRKRAFADAAERGYWIGTSHLSFPGLGHLRIEGKGYRWVPASYSVPR
jgi:glyoxylase-like metal-dependent hydrolase (beta-lactamase superfamily II)